MEKDVSTHKSTPEKRRDLIKNRKLLIAIFIILLIVLGAIWAFSGL